MVARKTVSFRTVVLLASFFVCGLINATAVDGAPRTPGRGERQPASVEAAANTAPQDGANRTLLLAPDHPEWNAHAPERFRARFVTSKGELVIDVHHDWAPLATDRFYNLVRLGFYDDTRVFRIRAGVFAQFGLSGDPEINAVWYQRTIPDDPPGQQSTRGRVFFAMRGPDDRTTQVVISLRDNFEYYEQGFVPFGEVIEGMETVDGLYSGYGESAGGGMRGGNQGRIVAEGNAHLDADFPLLEHIYRAVIE